MNVFTIREIIKERIMEILALIIGVEAFLVMIGWIFGIDFLTRILPGGINMKFPTALMFFFSAVALYLIFRIVKDDNELSLVILPGIMLLLFLIMGAILTAIITGAQTGIEGLFVELQGPVYASGSGLPSIISIINFILFGLACINSLFLSKRRQRIVSYIGWFILISGAVSILGYLSSAPVLYLGIYNLTPIALNSSLCFFLLGCALIIISRIKPTYEI